MVERVESLGVSDAQPGNERDNYQWNTAAVTMSESARKHLEFQIDQPRIFKFEKRSMLSQETCLHLVWWE